MPGENENEGLETEAEVQPGELDPNAPEIDPDLPETEDAEEDDDPLIDPLNVVITLDYARQVSDLVRERGHSQLADAFLAAEAGDFIVVTIEG